MGKDGTPNTTTNGRRSPLKVGFMASNRAAFRALNAGPFGSPRARSSFDIESTIAFANLGC
jgi:hypothetical protein